MQESDEIGGASEKKGKAQRAVVVHEYVTSFQGNATDS